MINGKHKMEKILPSPESTLPPLSHPADDQLTSSETPREKRNYSLQMSSYPLQPERHPFYGARYTSIVDQQARYTSIDQQARYTVADQEW